MSNRAAKAARRAKRKAKQVERTLRKYTCFDCGDGPLYRGGIVVGGAEDEKHYCKDCMSPERLAAIMESWGKPIYRTVIGPE